MKSTRIHERLKEESALKRPEDDEDFGDPDEQSELIGRRGELARHLQRIRRFKAKPEQQVRKPASYDDVTSTGELEPSSERRGPGDAGGFDKTHAQQSADMTSDDNSYMGREADDERDRREKMVASREKQAVKSGRRRIKHPGIMRSLMLRGKPKHIMKRPKSLHIPPKK